GLSENTIEQALAAKSIIRTWLFRGTLHFVAAADIHWLLDLVSAKIIRSSYTRNKQLELDEALFKKCNGLLIRSFKTKATLTREEVASKLAGAGINTAAPRLYHLLHRAALEKIICIGPKQGKQFTYMLVNHCVPPGKPLKKEEALYQLALRYFKSHGPATLQDFLWWSGLTITDAKTALEFAKSTLLHVKDGADIFWFTPNHEPKKPAAPKMHLLAGYDEYVLGYKDRSLFMPPAQSKEVMTNNGIFNPTIVYDGQVIGTWKRLINKHKTVEIKTNMFKVLTTGEQKKLIRAMKRYETYLDKTVVLKEE
ncbi:MAG TPA: winged helix DNA-binding domain-containing protein, partial [Agriterribacter sp.]|nr:winged helix DNA-binding domain-containing protein [Agriterribacter sp.]